MVTSAGVSAGIDLALALALALALVEEDHGGELAREVARSLVVFLQRPGGQSQFSPSLRGPGPRGPVLREVVAAVTADPTADHSTRRPAAIAAVSERQLTRLFRGELDTTPAQYVQAVRFRHGEVRAGRRRHGRRRGGRRRLRLREHRVDAPGPHGTAGRLAP